MWLPPLFLGRGHEKSGARTPFSGMRTSWRAFSVAQSDWLKEFAVSYFWPIPQSCFQEIFTMFNSQPSPMV